MGGSLREGDFSPRKRGICVTSRWNPCDWCATRNLTAHVTKTIMEYHKSVLLKEVVEYLDLKPSDIVLDATFGFGGHSQAILDKLGPKGRIIGFEQDRRIYQTVTRDLPSRITLINDNFVYYRKHLDKLGIKKFNSVLFDLGVSSWHFDSSKSGFSFKGDEDLDMRMNLGSRVTARDIINKYSEAELADILYYLSDERDARRIAREIVAVRRRLPIVKTRQLVEIVGRVKGRRNTKINPATQVFQSLRIEVNHELSYLKTTLESIVDDLKVGGRAVVLSYHSKEDKITKEVFKKKEREGIVEIITKKPIVPSEEELLQNPRSRSAKMRVIRRK